MKKKPKYTRRCRRCEELYKTTCKWGKICDDCRLPTGVMTEERLKQC
ncbi:hypothetical protein K8R33_02815 [archaeon]|nr:hypothetical protein [archaeon]